MRARCERRANTAWRTASDLNLVVARYVVWDFENSPWCEERKPGYRSYCHPDHFQPLSHPRAPYSGRRASAHRRDPSAQAPGRGRTRGCSHAGRSAVGTDGCTGSSGRPRGGTHPRHRHLRLDAKWAHALAPSEVGGQPRGRSAKRCGEATIGSVGSEIAGKDGPNKDTTARVYCFLVELL